MARLNITEMMWPNGGINGEAVSRRADRKRSEVRLDGDVAEDRSSGLGRQERRRQDPVLQRQECRSASVPMEKGWEGNELTNFNRDILVLANPEIANLPGWVIGLVAAGGLAAALSTAAGSVAGDLVGGLARPDQGAA
jgi:cation/acetate symporter